MFPFHACSLSFGLDSAWEISSSLWSAVVPLAAKCWKITGASANNVNRFFISFPFCYVFLNSTFLCLDLSTFASLFLSLPLSHTLSLSLAWFYVTDREGTITSLYHTSTSSDCTYYSLSQYLLHLEHCAYTYPLITTLTHTLWYMSTFLTNAQRTQSSCFLFSNTCTVAHTDFVSTM